MRNLLAFVLMIALVGSATAVDLGNVSHVKNNDHIGLNPGTPDGRQGGEMGNPFVVDGFLPFNDTGNTSGMADEYDVICPYGGSTAPDAWYSWTAPSDIVVSIDLCGSSYDTKVFVLVDGAEYACNDDAYFDDVCGNYVSLIEGMAVNAGVTYMIAIDGYGGDFGDYILKIEEFYGFGQTCFLTCEGLAEGEPELMEGYEDAYNGGCNSPEFGTPFLDLTNAADSNGELVFCGISGFFDGYRDSDWMNVAFGELGLIEWTLDAEQKMFGYLLGGDCASGPTFDEQIIAGSCSPATMVLLGNPGDVIQLCVFPTAFGGPYWFVGHEFNYVANFTGLAPGETVATENVSFDGIKSLYR